MHESRTGRLIRQLSGSFTIKAFSMDKQMGNRESSTERRDWLL